MEGEVLSNRYAIEERIGEGGMALVYKAKDRLLHRWVAVKVLREQYTSDEDFVERFRREAQAAASLSHPNVVNIYDVGEVQDTYYIVMEYVRGTNLKELIRKEGKLTPEQSVGIALQVAAALSHAHRRHLVHRDIKPHNILITDEGQVKVTDFGIARAASTATLTQTGLIIGSVHYFSPEQARGGVSSEQSDIYSLGIVLYEMLTGKVPFTGETPIAVALQQLQEPVPSPRKLDPGIPKPLEDVILKALAKEPEERFRSADEFILALQKTGIKTDVPVAWGNGEAGELRDDLGSTRMVPASQGEEATRVHRLGRGEKVSKGKNSRSPARRRVRAFGILFLIAFLGGLFWAASYLPQLIFPAEVSVPDVVGLTVTEARLALEKQGLHLAVDKEVESQEVAAGRVIRQDPAALRKVKEGRTVWVVVSRGSRLIPVPDVVGLHIDEAKKQIIEAGLTVGVETPVLEATVLQDYVVSQSPQPGTFLEEGLAVDLMVSREGIGRPLVVVPDLKGQPLEEAKARVRRLGLMIGHVWGDSNPALAPWEVILQNPPPGERVPQDSPIDFVYNSWGTGQPTQEPPEDFPTHGGQSGDTTELPEDTGTTSAGEVSSHVREASVQVTVPPGPEQEVVVIVIDALGAREAYRGTHPGETTITRHVRGYGNEARIQVYIDNLKVSETGFPGR
ncbi:MAG: Stk1 family PASTA domain-containing Ser/Thr kinase [Firmicutes bacterium]|jgi:beta-lactam-binding protein with PASTA domain/tRNA A-37 threonylcarbamoyl transferase component Bud32|nr:Stk1 family PASTA domain-containing Ser/Thr kinase [Bacillota bacterium]